MLQHYFVHLLSLKILLKFKNFFISLIVNLGDHKQKFNKYRIQHMLRALFMTGGYLTP